MEQDLLGRGVAVDISAEISQASERVPTRIGSAVEPHRTHQVTSEPVVTLTAYGSMTPEVLITARFARWHGGARDPLRPCQSARVDELIAGWGGCTCEWGQWMDQ